MRTLAKSILNTSLCIFSLFTASALAQQTAAGGVIHFRGEVVEAPCQVKTQSQQIELSCIRDGRMQNSQFKQQQVTMAPQHFQQLASVKMHYLNEQKNQAILNIEYN